MVDLVDQKYEDGELMREPDPATNSVSRAYPYGGGVENKTDD